MSTLTKVLEKNVAEIEKNADMKEGRFRLGHHLMPPVGWLNDPNGLCWYKGKYHVFFQYAPFDVEGGLKFWGHYTSVDLVDWKYEGTALYPDSPYDCHGVYSGSALVEDEKMHLFFTGNVKIDGDYDYINEGRETSTLHVESEDGIHFGDKEEIISFEKYPEDFTCHIRDPKVWKKNNRYYMILGGRLKEDKGAILVYGSEDMKDWKLDRVITTPEAFGYMWECPDYFTIGDKKILSASVQGLEGGIWEERNVYQSGYFEVEGDILSSYKLGEYKLWDYGFDYYAPQSFETEDGRRIHISWMGMPDCEAYTNLTIADGWQHCFTLPREIYVKDGKICQRPIRELDYKEAITKTAENKLQADSCKAYDLKIDKIQNNQFCIALAEELLLEYTDGRFRMRFTDNRKTCVSAGRDCRYVETDEVTNIRVIADVSSVEVFVNDGEYVFSTRYYPDKYSINVQAEGADICLAEIK